MTMLTTVTYGSEAVVLGRTYLEMSFPPGIQRETFARIAKLLKSEGCFFSKDIRKWFCPVGRSEDVASAIGEILRGEVHRG